MFLVINYSIIVSILIVLGLYIVLWGKGKELKRTLKEKLTEDVEPFVVKEKDIVPWKMFQ